MNKKRAHGFTLIELLIVMLIIAVLAALLLPVFNRVKENARQTQCLSNISQLGKALIQYENAHRMYPPGIISWNANPTATGAPGSNLQECRYSVTDNDNCQINGLGRFSMVSGLTLVLPYLGERTCYEAYNMNLACCSEANATSTANVIKSFICPSNPRGNSPLAAGSSQFYRGLEQGYTGVPATAKAINGVGPTDYALCMGGNALMIATCQSPARIDTKARATFPPAFKQAAGVFYLNSNVSSSKMSDGASNTLLAGEAAGGPEMRVGTSTPGATGSAAVFPTAGSTNLTPTSALPGYSIDTPWSQGYIGSPSGNGGYGCVMAASAFDAWYNYFTPNQPQFQALATAGQGLPSIQQLDLMPAYGPSGATSAITSRGGGFTPLKLNMAKVKWNRATAVEQNDNLAIQGIPVDPTQPFAGKVEIIGSGRQISVSGFRSYHPGLVIMVYADSHTAKLLEDTDPRLLVGLSTYAGREITQSK